MEWEWDGKNWVPAEKPWNPDDPDYKEEECDT